MISPIPGDLASRLEALEARSIRQTEQLDRIEALLKRLDQAATVPFNGETSLERSGKFQSNVFVRDTTQSGVFSHTPRGHVAKASATAAPSGLLEPHRTIGRIHSNRSVANATATGAGDEIIPLRPESSSPGSVDLVAKVELGNAKRRRSRVGFASDAAAPGTAPKEAVPAVTIELPSMGLLDTTPTSSPEPRTTIAVAPNPLITSSMEMSDGGTGGAAAASWNPAASGSGSPPPGASRRRRKALDTSGGQDPWCKILEKAPPVDSNHDMVYLGDAAFIVLSFAACCVAVVCLSPEVGFDQNAMPGPGLIVWVVLLGLVSVGGMIVRGGFVRKKVGDDIADTHGAIARAYARSWFVPDVLVSMPFELFFLGWLNPAFYYLQSKHFLRLLRLKSLIYSSNPLLPGRPLLLFIALTGCCVLVLFILAAIFSAVDAEGRPLVTALYWATATFTSTGYGDIPVIDSSSQGFAIAAMCVSTLLLSFVQAMSTSLLTSRDVTQEDLTRKKQTMYFMLNHYGVPWEVQKDVVFTFPAVLELHREHLFKEMIQDLPPSVTTKLEFYVKVRVVHETPYFDSLFRTAPESAEVIAAAVAELLSVRKMNLGEFLVQPAQPCLELFIVQSGVAEVVRFSDEGDEVLATLRRGMTLGSISCRSPDDLEWVVAAQAVQPCELYTLHRVDYQSLLARFPALRMFRGDATTTAEAEWTAEIPDMSDNNLAAVASMSDRSSFRFGGGGSFGGRPRRKSQVPNSFVLSNVDEEDEEDVENGMGLI